MKSGHRFEDPYKQANIKMERGAEEIPLPQAQDTLMRGSLHVPAWMWMRGRQKSGAEGQQKANQRELVETDMNCIQISPSRTNHNAI